MVAGVLVGAEVKTAAQLESGQQRIVGIRCKKVSHLEIAWAVDGHGHGIGGLVIQEDVVGGIGRDEFVGQGGLECVGHMENCTLARAAKGRLDGVVAGPLPKRRDRESVPGVLSVAEERLGLIAEVGVDADLLLAPIGIIGGGQDPVVFVAGGAAVGQRYQAVQQVGAVSESLLVKARHGLHGIVSNAIERR